MAVNHTVLSVLRRQRNRQRRRIASLGRHCALAASFLLLNACATDGNTPSALWLLGATIRSLAGAPPIPADFYEEPVLVSDTLKLTAITSGGDHTCALTVDGDTYCWGSNQYQELGTAELTETCGNGTFTCSSTPVRLRDAPRFTALAASSRGACGLDESGTAHCWGFGLGGRRERALPASSGVPVEVPGGHTFRALSASPRSHRTCGQATDGRTWCWSFNNAPGSGDSQVFAGPDLVAPSSGFVSIAVGGGHECGIDAVRDVFCWGSNQLGQLGVGASALEGGVDESLAPVAVQGGLKLERIAAGPNFTCGLDTESALYCWGAGFPVNSSARVRDRRSMRSIPHGAHPILLDTMDPKWVELDAGGRETCGLSADGEVFCFETTPLVVDKRPKRIESGQAFVAFAVGGSHTCAIGADALAYCWGMSQVGQVGRAPKGGFR